MAEKDEIGIDYQDIVYIDVDKLKFDPDNPNQHDEEDVNELMKSIKDYGWTEPIIVQGDLTIIDGHGRAMAAKKLGIKEVPCLVTSISGMDAKAYMIANKEIFLMGKWDTEQLPVMMNNIQRAGVDLEVTGMHGEELEAATGKMKAKLEEQAKRRPPTKCVCPGCNREFKVVEQKEKSNK
jgi:hypothetical protein